MNDLKKKIYEKVKSKGAFSIFVLNVMKEWLSAIADINLLLCFLRWPTSGGATSRTRSVYLCPVCLYQGI